MFRWLEVVWILLVTLKPRHSMRSDHSALSPILMLIIIIVILVIIVFFMLGLLLGK